MTEDQTRFGPEARAPSLIQQRFGADISAIEISIEQSRSQIHGFMKRFLRCKRIEDETAVAMFKSIAAHARSVVDKNEAQCPVSDKKSHVPKIIHRIWLTDSIHPASPPLRYIREMIDDASQYADDGWSSWFWTRDPKLIPKTLAEIQDSGAPIVVKSYQPEIMSGQPWENNFERLLSDRKFAFAADLLRMQILFQFGGVYADMGARFRERQFANFVAENFDYAFIFWDTLFFQNSLMMMPPHSMVGQIYMEIANNPDYLPRSLFYEWDGIEEGMAFSGLLITALLLFSNPEALRICPLAPNGEAVEWSSERSWYTRDESGTGKFGGAYIPDTPATVLRQQTIKREEPHLIFLP